MSNGPTTIASENKERIKESVDTLKQLYSVVIALALAEAIVSPVSKTGADVTIHYAALPWFVALVLTLIPFHHGAMRHLDDAYVFTEARYRKLTFLVDYLILFTEAGAFVWLGLVMASPHAFSLGYAILLAIDVFWATATHFLTNRFATIRPWLLTNMVTLSIMGLIHWTPALDRAEPIYLVFVAVARTIADYGFSWDFYFPEAEDRAN